MAVYVLEKAFEAIVGEEKDDGNGSDEDGKGPIGGHFY